MDRSVASSLREEYMTVCLTGGSSSYHRTFAHADFSSLHFTQVTPILALDPRPQVTSQGRRLTSLAGITLTVPAPS